MHERGIYRVETFLETGLYAIKITELFPVWEARDPSASPYGSAPAFDDFDSTHGSVSTAVNDCQRHEYYVE